MAALFRVIGALSCACAAAASTTVLPSFSVWAHAHARAYATPAAEAAARAAFAENAALVAAHELERAAGRATHSLALNAFADMTAADFAAAFGLGAAAAAPGLLRGAAAAEATMAAAALPSGVDWLARGFVPPVRNSGACADGGTLAFAAAVSAAGGILAGKLTTLYDPAQIGACDGCGCNGCLASAPWAWALKHGVTSNFSASGDGCGYAATLRVTRENRVQPRNDTALAAALVSGPTLVAIDLAALQLYSGGIVTSACAPTVDSIVMAVTYEPSFFRIQNTWGAGWGEKGFARIGRGGKAPAEGYCGILSSAAWPTVEAA